jgi:hypothetical protein
MKGMKELKEVPISLRGHKQKFNLSDLVPIRLKLEEAYL